MPTYSTDDFERIATAVGRDAADIAQHANSFEAAAVWYRLDKGAPNARDRIGTSKMTREMKRLAKGARKLLKHLEVHDPRAADDGQRALVLVEQLASAGDNDDDAVNRSIARVARLVAFFEAIEAIHEIEQRADKAAKDSLHIGELIVPKGHHGNRAVNDWVAAMIETYRKITGREPGTSVGQVGQPNEGIASGPFVRFLVAAGRPLDISYSEDAWRGRYRTLLSAH